MKALRNLLGNGKDQKLMELFLSLTGKAVQGMSLLNSLLTEYSNVERRQFLGAEIERLEEEGDTCCGRVINQLADIAITSWIPHETVLRLVQQMDQLLDGCRGVVRTLRIYQLNSVSSFMISLSSVNMSAVVELQIMMTLFCQPHWHKHTKDMARHIVQVSKLEHLADQHRANGLQELWRSGPMDDQPVTKRQLAELKGTDELIKMLETISDDAHHWASTIHQIISA